MKKIFALLLSGFFLFLSACGASSTAPGQTGTQTSPAAPAVSAAVSEPVPSPASAPSPDIPSSDAVSPSALPSPADTASDSIDVDLTQLSSTMVYAEVYAMMVEPEEYLGKTIKMNGSFSAFEVDGKRYYACVVQDATACCEQGLEFELSGNPRFPEDYPERGADITVVGVYDLYQEIHDGNTYNYMILRNAEFC